MPADGARASRGGSLGSIPESEEAEMLPDANLALVPIGGDRGSVASIASDDFAGPDQVELIDTTATGPASKFAPGRESFLEQQQDEEELPQIDQDTDSSSGVETDDEERCVRGTSKYLRIPEFKPEKYLGPRFAALSKKALPRKWKDLTVRDLAISNITEVYFVHQFNMMRTLLWWWAVTRLMYFLNHQLEEQFLSVYYEPIYVKNAWSFTWDVNKHDEYFGRSRFNFMLASMMMTWSSLIFPLLAGYNLISDFLMVICIAGDAGRTNVTLSGYKRKYASITDAKRNEASSEGSKTRMQVIQETIEKKIQKYANLGGASQKLALATVVHPEEKIARITLYLKDYRVFRYLSRTSTYLSVFFILAVTYFTCMPLGGTPARMERFVFACCAALFFIKGLRERADWGAQFKAASSAEAKLPGDFDILVGYFRERGTLLYQIDLRGFFVAILILASKSFFSLWRRPYKLMPWNGYLLFCTLEFLLDIPLFCAFYFQYMEFYTCFHKGARRHARLVDREREKVARERLRDAQRTSGQRTTLHHGTGIYRSEHRSGAIRLTMYQLTGLKPKFAEDYLLQEADKIFYPLIYEDRAHHTTTTGILHVNMNTAVNAVRAVNAMSRAVGAISALSHVAKQGAAGSTPGSRNTVATAQDRLGTDHLLMAARHATAGSAHHSAGGEEGGPAPSSPGGGETLLPAGDGQEEGTAAGRQSTSADGDAQPARPSEAEQQV
ncbi:unnamed protein product [Amoebophrya sp. A120]|nr:unnamed protein product [Amoebophrya sp. A120]|eukprot:GSA120T00025799001.1